MEDMPLSPDPTEDQFVYVFYPSPRISCSKHPKLGVKSRHSHDIMMHLCGKGHLNRLVQLPSKQTAVKPMVVIHVCCICEECIVDPSSHFRLMHPGVAIHDETADPIDLAKLE